jgi:hypothetical protein
MLETSNILNTNKKIFFNSNKFKNITMSNQQEFKYNLFNILRDYTQRVIILFKKQRKLLRYSPTFCINNILIIQNFISIFKIKLLNVRLNLFKRSSIYLNNSKGLINTNCYYSTQSLNKVELNPMWLTGFVDAEGCFSIIIEILGPSKWRVRTSFEINLHERDKEVLYLIKDFFGVGQVYNRSDRRISVYRVSNINDLNDKIIPHFYKYPLISKKSIDFLLWVKVIKIILNKEHLTKSGFLIILSYYASINRGMSKKVLKFYPNIKPYEKPSVNLPEILNPYWVSGFVAGDGGFSIYVRPISKSSSSEKVNCRFHVAQHIKDIELMKLFIDFFKCGTVYTRSNSAVARCDFIVQDFKSLWNTIIPHFDSYPILSLKNKDFICFKECMSIIISKTHLTEEGIRRIKTLLSEMNLNRYK